jgi:hypothetical protein
MRPLPFRPKGSLIEKLGFFSLIFFSEYKTSLAQKKELSFDYFLLENTG